MDYKETSAGKLKPIVTLLTEALVKDFAPAYRRVPGLDYDLWIRTAEDGTEAPVSSDQLWKDVQEWLLSLEKEMENGSDHAYAQMVTHMIRKNPGWVTLLCNRVKKRLSV